MNRIAVGLVLVLCACSSKSTCDATSCAAGCCDSSGICQPGTAADACGKAGSGTCGVCTATQACVANACAAVATDGGTGGGSAAGGGSAVGGGTAAGGGTGSVGGGTGSVGGGSGGGAGDAGPYDDGGMHYCVTTRTISSFAGPIIDAGFDGYTWLIESIPDPDGGYDAFDLETFINTQANQPVPGFSALDGGTAGGGSTNYSDCGVCPILFEGCSDSALTCRRTYLGISGDVNIITSIQNVPGSAYVTVSNLTFVEWDFGFDGPVHDGACVFVGSATFDAGWTDDAGSP